MSKEKDFRKARLQAARCGIVLTRRRDKNGDYVCYLSKKARESGLFGI